MRVSGRHDLFDGRAWVLTPTADETDPDVVALVTRRGPLGRCRGRAAWTPQRHDAAVAAVSHVPQLAASLVAARLEGLDEAAVALAGQGLRDVTRIAASDPDLWTQILAGNAPAVRDGARRAGGRPRPGRRRPRRPQRLHRRPRRARHARARPRGRRSRRLRSSKRPRSRSARPARQAPRSRRAVVVRLGRCRRDRDVAQPLARAGQALDGRVGTCETAATAASCDAHAQAADQGDDLGRVPCQVGVSTRPSRATDRHRARDRPSVAGRRPRRAGRRARPR